MLCAESSKMSSALSESIGANMETKVLLTIQVVHVCFYCTSLEAECAFNKTLLQLINSQNITILALNKYVDSRLHNFFLSLYFPYDKV